MKYPEKTDKLPSIPRSLKNAGYNLVGGGIHEAECRIDGCMIHALVLTEIHLAQIHGGYAESAPDRDEKCRCQQKECKRDILTSIRNFQGLFLPDKDAIEDKV